MILLSSFHVGGLAVYYIPIDTRNVDILCFLIFGEAEARKSVPRNEMGLSNSIRIGYIRVVVVIRHWKRTLWRNTVFLIFALLMVRISCRVIAGLVISMLILCFRPKSPLRAHFLYKSPRGKTLSRYASFAIFFTWVRDSYFCSPPLKGPLNM